MTTLTLEFHPGPPIRLQARSPLTGDAADNFGPPLTGEALAASLQALEPGFDADRIESVEVVETLQAAGLPLGSELLSAVGDGLGQSLRDCPKVFRAFELALAAARAERRPLRLELRFAAGCDEVAALPWELLRYQQRFLVADNDVTMVRTPLGTTLYPTHHLSLFCRFPGRPAT